MRAPTAGWPLGGRWAPAGWPPVARRLPAGCPVGPVSDITAVGKFDVTEMRTAEN